MSIKTGQKIEVKDSTGHWVEATVTDVGTMKFWVESHEREISYAYYEHKTEWRKLTDKPDTTKVDEAIGLAKHYSDEHWWFDPDSVIIDTLEQFKKLLGE